MTLRVLRCLSPLHVPLHGICNHYTLRASFSLKSCILVPSYFPCHTLASWHTRVCVSCSERSRDREEGERSACWLQMLTRDDSATRAAALYSLFLSPSLALCLNHAKSEIKSGEEDGKGERETVCRPSFREQRLVLSLVRASHNEREFRFLPLEAG